MSIFSARMKLTEAAKFCQRFGPGLKAGLDVLKLLDAEGNYGPSAQKRAMARLAANVRGGDEVGSAMASDPFFPPTLSAIMVAGDESGKVDRAILLLGQHYQSRVEARRDFISSIAFPIIQLLGGILVISLLIYVMGILTPPGGGQMTDLLGFGLMGGSGVLWFWLYCGLFFGSIAVAIFLYLRNFAGVQNLVPILYMIPKIGPALQTITLSKFCTAMALAFESGLDPMKSIRLGLAATGSDYYAGGGKIAEEAIRGGADLAGGLHKTGIFPRDLLSQIDIAEQSGTSAEAMNRLAEDYDRRAKSAIKVMAGIATLLIRILVIGIFVFMIFRIASVYLGAIGAAMEPINPRRQ